MTRRNFHTHTYLCKHATGYVADYCREALTQHLDVLGFTDHSPMPDGRWDSVRMNVEQLPSYVADMKAAAHDFPTLRIIPGMECEYAPDLLGFYRDVLLGEYSLTLIACGMHSYIHNGQWQAIYGTIMDHDCLHSYTDFLISAIECELFSFIAHPDLFGLPYRGWDAEADACARAIVQCAVAHDTPLEVNAYGLRKKTLEDHGEIRHAYPWHPFWEAAANYPVKVLVNSDAHRPEDVWGNNDDAINFIGGLGLNIVNDSFLTDTSKGGAVTCAL